MYKYTLTRRIIGLICLSLAAASYLILLRSEAILEEALLDQTKQQAQTFLLGLESQLRSMEKKPSEADYQKLINTTIKRDLSSLDFSIYQIYVFDREGKILAHSVPGEHRSKNMKPHYLEIFNAGKSRLGNKVEQVVDSNSDRTITKTDIIIPFHFQDEVVAAFEVEIDIEKTLVVIQQLDDQYEKELLIIIILTGSFTLLLIWGGIKRWLLGPIVDMRELTNKISKGDLKARLDVASRDELGRLCYSINRMADSIETLF